MKEEKGNISSNWGKTAFCDCFIAETRIFSIRGQNDLYASAVYDKDENCYIIKVANTSKEVKDIRVNLTGVKKNATFTVGECTVMQNNDMKAINTLDTPLNIVPQKTNGTMEGNVFVAKTQPQSFNLYKIKL